MPFIRCPNCCSRFVTTSEWHNHMFLIHDCIDAQPTAALIVKQEPLDYDEVGNTEQTESEPPTYCSLTPVDEHPSVISLDVDNIECAINSHFKHALSNPQPQEKQTDPAPQEQGPRVQLFGAIESDDVDEKVHRIIYDGIVSHICKDESVTDPIAAIKPPPKQVPKKPDEVELERQRVLTDVEAAVHAAMGGAEASLLELDTTEQNPETEMPTLTRAQAQTEFLPHTHARIANQYGLKLPSHYPCSKAQEWDLRRMQRIVQKRSRMHQVDDIAHSVVKNARTKSVNDSTVSFAARLVPKLKVRHKITPRQIIPQSGLVILTTEERRLLSDVGVVLPSHYPLTLYQQKELYRVRRMIKNKLSAKQSRVRKEQYIRQLEHKVTSLNHEAILLREENQSLLRQNHALRGQLKSDSGKTENGLDQEGATGDVHIDHEATILLREENESLLLRNQALLEQLKGASSKTALQQETSTGGSATKEHPAKCGGQIRKRTRVLLRRKVKEEQK